MITIGKHRIRSFLTLEYDFSGIRIVERELIPVHWSLTINLVPSQKKRKNLEEIAQKAELTYQRLYFWLESVLSNVIVVNTTNTLGMTIAATSSNVMMMCPDEPYDEVIVEMLHSKLTALSSGNMLIGEIHLKGDDVTASYNFDCPDGEYNLPQTVKDYISIPSKYNSPWWMRNDGFCFEFLKPEEQKEVPDEKYFGNIRDPMLDFDSTMKELSGIDSFPIEEQATIIQVERWKPRKV